MDEKFVGFCIAVQNFRIFSLNLQPFKRSPERQFLRKISFVLAQFMSLPLLVWNLVKENLFYYA